MLQLDAQHGPSGADMSNTCRNGAFARRFTELNVMRTDVGDGRLVSGWALAKSQLADSEDIFSSAKVARASATNRFTKSPAVYNRAIKYSISDEFIIHRLRHQMALNMKRLSRTRPTESYRTEQGQ
jgi:hypothetical protein